MAGMQISRAARCAQTRERNARRKRENIERDQQRKRFSPQEQLKRLDFRLGVGQGAVKERKKLHEKMKVA